MKKSQACSIPESGSESKNQWLFMYKMLIVTLLSSDITNVWLNLGMLAENH